MGLIFLTQLAWRVLLLLGQYHPIQTVQGTAKITLAPRSSSVGLARIRQQVQPIVQIVHLGRTRLCWKQLHAHPVQQDPPVLIRRVFRRCVHLEPIQHKVRNMLQLQSTVKTCFF